MHIHILGICGTFMGGVAALAKASGVKVTGCDAGIYPPMSDQLKALGIELIEGYGVEQLALKPDVFVVGNVVSRARFSNGQAKYPLMEAILNEGLLYTSGPQWLSEFVLQSHHVLAIAGTHGKTTTTAMLAWILECCGKKPGFLIGGVPQNFKQSARLSGSNNKSEQRFFVVEADEYDTAFFDKRSKFIHYRPQTLILNNLEFDHADIFDSLAAIEKQFSHLLRTVPSNGRVIVNGLEESLIRVLNQGCWSEVRSFGAVNSDFYSIGTPEKFEVFQQGASQGMLEWEISGQYNMNNALAAIAAAQHVGIAPTDAIKALKNFVSVKRRMEKRYTVLIANKQDPITIWDDFAHHPTAIRATIDGLRQKIGNQARILAIFEPRSNTMKLGNMREQLPWSLEQADLTYCYSAGLDWDAKASLQPLGERAFICASIDDLLVRIQKTVQPGDHLLCMSNGGFSGIHEKLQQKLEQK